MDGVTLSWRLRPLGHLTGLNLDDSMRKGWDVQIKKVWASGWRDHAMLARVERVYRCRLMLGGVKGWVYR
jgi:hypothetical protein